MSVLRLPPLIALRSWARIARCKNPGAESDMPTLANAMPPDFRKNLRFINVPLLPLKLRRAQNHADNFRRRIVRVCLVDLFQQRLARRRGDVARQKQFERLVNQLRLVLRAEFREIDPCAGNAIARERETEVHALEQCARVHPILGGVGITVRRLKAVKRLAHARDPLMSSWSTIRVRAESSDRTDDEFEKPPDLHPVRFRRI